MTKVELRAQVRVEKRKRSQEELREMSEQIVDRLLHNPGFLSARCVLLYCSLPDEVQTDNLLRMLAGEAAELSKQVAGRTILLPVVDGDDLILRRYEGQGSLQREPRFGILEPTGVLFTDYEEIDCAIVPGMAFDTAGHRLGRGRGYYDRLLPRLPNARLIGLCFPFQLVPYVPCEPHDVRMDEVVSCTPLEGGKMFHDFF